MVEVVTRTIHGRLLLRPDPETTERIAGVFARAQKLYDMPIHAVAVLSNHYHLLLSPRDAEHLARFMGHVNSNIAREIGRLRGWRQKFWGDRYQVVAVSGEEEAQVARLHYVLSQGVKEQLVERSEQWPGLHCARALRDGEDLLGRWFDRTTLNEATRYGRKVDPRAHSEELRMVLSPLPCWQDRSTTEIQRLVGEILETIRDEAEVARRAVGSHVAGAQRLTVKSPLAPRCSPERFGGAPIHAASREVRRRFVEARRWFLDAYRDASRRLRRGDSGVMFPDGCFPPGLPFTGFARTG
jgi:REP element-mobilizing transposase RayT